MKKTFLILCPVLFSVTLKAQLTAGYSFYSSPQSYSTVDSSDYNIKTSNVYLIVSWLSFDYYKVNIKNLDYDTLSTSLKSFSADVAFDIYFIDSDRRKEYSGLTFDFYFMINSDFSNINKKHFNYKAYLGYFYEKYNQRGVFSQTEFYLYSSMDFAHHGKELSLDVDYSNNIFNISYSPFSSIGVGLRASDYVGFSVAYKQLNDSYVTNNDFYSEFMYNRFNFNTFLFSYYFTFQFYIGYQWNKTLNTYNIYDKVPLSLGSKHFNDTRNLQNSNNYENSLNFGFGISFSL